MENASKALIIAGAILLAILIIAIGMYIYNSSQNSISGSVGQISQQEINAFNQQWLVYEGDQSGSNIKALLSKMNSNATINAEEETKLPDLYCEYSKGNAVKVLSEVGKTRKMYYMDNTTNNNLNNGFNKIRSRIEKGHKYNVTLVTHVKTGLISGIIIKYDSSGNAVGYDLYRVFAGL